MSKNQTINQLNEMRSIAGLPPLTQKQAVSIMESINSKATVRQGDVAVLVVDEHNGTVFSAYGHDVATLFNRYFNSGLRTQSEVKNYILSNGGVYSDEEDIEYQFAEIDPADMLQVATEYVAKFSTAQEPIPAGIPDGNVGDDDITPVKVRDTVIMFKRAVYRAGSQSRAFIANSKDGVKNFFISVKVY